MCAFMFILYLTSQDQVLFYCEAAVGFNARRRRKAKVAEEIKWGESIHSPFTAWGRSVLYWGIAIVLWCFILWNFTSLFGALTYFYERISTNSFGCGNSFVCPQLRDKEDALLDTASELSAMEMELQVLIPTRSLLLPLQIQALVMFQTIVEFKSCKLLVFLTGPSA